MNCFEHRLELLYDKTIVGLNKNAEQDSPEAKAEMTTPPTETPASAVEAPSSTCPAADNTETESKETAKDSSAPENTGDSDYQDLLEVEATIKTPQKIPNPNQWNQLNCDRNMAINTIGDNESENLALALGGFSRVVLYLLLHVHWVSWLFFHVSAVLVLLNLSLLQAPQLTRREQLGTDAESLKKEEEDKPRATIKRPASRKAEAKSAPKRASKKQDTKDKDTKDKDTKDKDTKGKDTKDKDTKGKDTKDKDSGKRKEKSRKGDTEEPATKKAKAKQAAKSKKNEDGEDLADDSKKVPATWAGRWIPSVDGPQKTRMLAIKKVFEESIAKKLKRQSLFQSPFFKMASQECARTLPKDATFEDYVGCAEVQVADFLRDEKVRSLATTIKKKTKTIFCFPTLSFGDSNTYTEFESGA